MRDELGLDPPVHLVTIKICRWQRLAASSHQVSTVLRSSVKVWRKVIRVKVNEEMSFFGNLVLRPAAIGLQKENIPIFSCLFQLHIIHQLNQNHQDSL